MKYRRERVCEPGLWKTTIGVGWRQGSLRYRFRLGLDEIEFGAKLTGQEDSFRTFDEKGGHRTVGDLEYSVKIDEPYYVQSTG